MRILRRVVDRRQDFRSTQDYPEGFIVETLECGHERIEAIFDIPGDRLGEKAIEVYARASARMHIENPSDQHIHQASRRRCEECEKIAKKRGDV